VKKLFLAIILFVPVLSYAACPCDGDVEEDGVYHEYDYVGLKAGTGHYLAPTVQGSSKSYGMFYGHRSSKLFGYEAEYSFLGTYIDAASPGHAIAFSLSGLHYYDLSEDFSLVGRLGLASTKTSNAVALRQHAFDLTYGVGLDWRIAKDLHMRTEFNRYSLKMPEKVKATNAFVGLAYQY
jgi:hypothetical protein